jgi:hypothetical protein
MNYIFFSISLSQKHFFESFTWGIIPWTLWVFLLGLPNYKMTSIALNTSFHIDLGIFVGD